MSISFVFKFQKHFLLESVETKALCNGLPPAVEEKNILSLIFEFRDFIIAILIKYYEGQCLADKYTQNLCEHAVSDRGNCKRMHDRTTHIGGAEVFERTVNEHVGESRDSSHDGPSTEQDENFTFVTGNANIFSNADRSTQYPSEEIGFESTNGPHISTEHREIENVQPNDSQNIYRSHDILPTATENYSRGDSTKTIQSTSSLSHNRSARRDHLDLDKSQNNEEPSENDAESHQQTNEKRKSEIHFDVTKKPESKTIQLESNKLRHTKEHIFDTNVLECKEDHGNDNKRNFTENLPSSTIRNSEKLLHITETKSTRKTDHTYGPGYGEQNCKYCEKTFSEKGFEANETDITVKLPFETGEIGTAKRGGIALEQSEEIKEMCDGETPDFPGVLGDLENVFTLTYEELLNSASLDVDCCTGNDVCLNTSLTTSSEAMRRHHTDGCKKNATTSGNPKFFKNLRMEVRSESNLKIVLKKVLSPNSNDIDVADETRNYFTGNNQLPCFNHIRQLRQLREVTFIKQNVSNVRDRHLSSGIVLGVHNDRCESKAFNRSSLHETISDEREGSRAVGADGGSQLLTINSTSSETKAPLDVIAAIGVCSVTESMVYEWGRLKTFFNFPMNNPMMPVTLAKYGFYYTGDSDVVICFSCNVAHGNWQKGDSVYTVHYQKSRRCRFMNGEDKRNVPIHGDKAVSVDRRAGGRDISSRGSDGAEQNAILSTPGMVTSLFLELKPSKKTDTTGNIPKAAEGSGIKRGPPPATSASRASSRTAIQTTTSLQTVSPNSSATASPLTTTNPALTPKGAPNGHSSKMGSGDACNQQQPMNQQHPTTLDQRQQLRLEQTGGGQQPLQRQQDQTLVNGDARNSSNTGAATNFNNTEAAAARPRYPNYSSVTSRAGTFNGFPNHLDQTPLVMAKAGFFYAGYGDYVRCFVCGGGLRNWEPGDDPWVEHARWFPRCIHVKQHKGQSFINLVLQRQRELTLPNEYISIPGQTSSHGQSVTTQTASVQTHNDRQTGTTTSQKFAGKHTESKFETNNSTSTFGSPEKTDQELRQSFREDMNSPAVRGLIDMGYDDWTIQTAIQRLRQNQGSEELTEPALMEIISGFKKQTGSCNIQGPTAEAKEIQNVEFKTPRSQIARPGLRGGIAANSFTDEELKSIQEENAQLKEQMKCKICLDNDVCISFLPCGHLCCCAECAPVMVKCPICRQIIKGSVKTFLS
ncbi:uncharacterized protein [Argopecten irradians]|uniref:uncharacterized protein n=1 Tax=Argopecten irradians TaxID=31199 RepID=UPI00371334F2